MVKKITNQSLKQLESALQNFGLNQKEVKIYMTLIPLGGSPSSTVGNRCNIPRTTAKFICNQLVKKGLIEECTKGKTSYYSALPPQRIIQILINEKDEIDRTKNTLESIMESLLAMQNPGPSLPKVKFYTTFDEMKQLISSLVTRTKEGSSLLSFVSIVNIKEVREDLSNLIKKFTNDLKEKNIFNKVIAPDSPTTRLFKAQDHLNNRETRIIDTKLQFGGGQIFITSNHVYALNLEGKDFFGISIRSQVIFETCKALFSLAWTSTEKK